MATVRKNHNADFTGKVELEAIRQQKMINQKIRLLRNTVRIPAR